MKTINRLMKIINQAAQMTGKRFVVSHRLKTVKGKMCVCPDTHLSIRLVSVVEVSDANHASFACFPCRNTDANG